MNAFPNQPEHPTDQPKPSHPARLEALHERIKDFLASNGLAEFQNPFLQLVRQSLHNMEFVSLEELDTQKQVLERLREKVKTLESRVAELEQPHGSHPNT